MKKKTKSVLISSIIAVVISFIWILIFKYFSLVDFYSGMAILPAIVIGIFIFILSFFISLTLFNLINLNRNKRK